MDSISRRELRSVLKWALRPTSKAIQGHDGRLKQWFEHKLDGAVAWGMADKAKVSERAYTAVKLHYEKGWPIKIVAANLGVSERTVAIDLNSVMDYVIDNTDPKLVASLKPQVFNWRIGGCQHCGGDLLWEDEQAAYGCIQCSRYFDLEGNPIAYQLNSTSPYYQVNSTNCSFAIANT